MPSAPRESLRARYFKACTQSAALRRDNLTVLILRLTGSGSPRGGSQAHVWAEHLVAGQVILKVRANGFAMRDLEVIGLNAAFDEQLPIGLARDLVTGGNRELVNIESVQLTVDQRQEGFEINIRCRIRDHPDPVQRLQNRQAAQTIGGTVQIGKALLLVGHPAHSPALDQVQAWVRAGEAKFTAYRLIHQARAAVSAHIKERVGLAVPVPRQQQREASQIFRQKISGICDLAGMGCDQRCCPEQRALLNGKPL